MIARHFQVFGIAIGLALFVAACGRGAQPAAQDPAAEETVASSDPQEPDASAPSRQDPDSVATQYLARVVERFDDGEVMNQTDAICVADELASQVDWQGLDDAGILPDDLFRNVPLTEQLGEPEITALIESIEHCRGAGDVVLAIFQLDGQMEPAQLGCFADQMNERAARDILRLIMAEDQSAFTGTEGELVLGVCGQAVRAP